MAKQAFELKRLAHYDERYIQHQNAIKFAKKNVDKIKR